MTRTAPVSIARLVQHATPDKCQAGCRPLSPKLSSGRATRQLRAEFPFCPQSTRTFRSCPVERCSGLSSELTLWKCLRHEQQARPSPLTRFQRSEATFQAASEKLTSEQVPPGASNRQRAYEQNAHFYQNRILDPYLAQPVQKVTLRQLVVFGRNMTDERLLKGANYVRTELPVRLAHRIRNFQSLPFIVGTNPHVERVYDLYWSAFETLRNIPEIKSVDENKEFCRILSRLLDDHLSVIPQLTLGISECASSGVLDKRHADTFMNGALRSRVSRRVIAEHHIQLTGQWTGWWVGDDAKEGATTTLCRGTRKWDGVSACRDGEEAEWAARAAGAGLMGPPTQWEGRDPGIEAGRKMSVSSRRGAFTIPEIWPKDDSQLIGIVRSNIHAGATALKCAKTTADSIREAYGVEPPRVNIDGHTSALFTYIPGHIEYILFELLKNSMRATLQKYCHYCSKAKLECPMPGDDGRDADAASDGPTARLPLVERTMDRLPPIRITVCQGEQDIIFRVSDQGGGIPREIYDNLWSFSHLSTSNSRHPASSSSPTLHAFLRPTPRFLATVRETIPRFGLGIGLNMSRVYANYWGGDLSLYSVWGYGTDAYIRVSRLGNQMENLEFEDR